MKWTLKDITKLEQRGFKVKGIQSPPREAKLSKYGNKKTEIDGHVFDSKKEAYRYKELKLLLKYGEIGFLRLQVPYQLNSGGSHSLVYIADFVYLDSRNGQEIVEDVKGFKTTVYKKKKNLMFKVHGIKINEI